MEKPDLYSLLKQFSLIGGMAQIGQPGFCLLMALWQKSNELNWAHQFTMTNVELLYKSGYNSEKALIEKRNTMNQLGYFKYLPPKNRRACGTYILNFNLLNDYFLKHSSEYSNEHSIPDSISNSIEVSSDVNSNVHSEVNINKPNKTKPVNRYRYSPDQFRLAEILLAEILKNKPDLKKPNLESWADTFRLIIEADKRDVEVIKRVIIWCQTNDFWRANILSASKLREKFDTLELQMNQQKPRPPTGNQSGLSYLRQKMNGG